MSFVRIGPRAAYPRDPFKDATSIEELAGAIHNRFGHSVTAHFGSGSNKNDSWSVVIRAAFSGTISRSEQRTILHTARRLACSGFGALLISGTLAASALKGTGAHAFNPVEAAVYVQDRAQDLGFPALLVVDPTQNGSGISVAVYGEGTNAGLVPLRGSIKTLEELGQVMTSIDAAPAPPMHISTVDERCRGWRPFTVGPPLFQSSLQIVTSEEVPAERWNTIMRVIARTVYMFTDPAMRQIENRLRTVIFTESGSRGVLSNYAFCSRREDMLLDQSIDYDGYGGEYNYNTKSIVVKLSNDRDDESLISENPLYNYFPGFKTLQHELYHAVTLNNELYEGRTDLMWAEVQRAASALIELNTMQFTPTQTTSKLFKLENWNGNSRSFHSKQLSPEQLLANFMRNTDYAFSNKDEWGAYLYVAYMNTFNIDTLTTEAVSGAVKRWDELKIDFKEGTDFIESLVRHNPNTFCISESTKLVKEVSTMPEYRSAYEARKLALTVGASRRSADSQSRLSLLESTST